jgi:NAD(P)-dependent dehydrogenase (short-subunit alcohol dehydrogenase family)
MTNSRFGRIININSRGGLTSPANRLSYAMSKHALRALTQSLANELAPYGITVNDICPGPVDSDMLRDMGTAAVSAGRFSSLDEYLDDVRADMPTRRLVDPDEVAAVAEFLIAPSSGSCNGLALRVDGALLS